MTQIIAKQHLLDGKSWQAKLISMQSNSVRTNHNSNFIEGKAQVMLDYGTVKLTTHYSILLTFEKPSQIILPFCQTLSLQQCLNLLPQHINLKYFHVNQSWHFLKQRVKARHLFAWTEETYSRPNYGITLLRFFEVAYAFGKQCLLTFLNPKSRSILSNAFVNTLVHLFLCAKFIRWYTNPNPIRIRAEYRMAILLSTKGKQALSLSQKCFPPTKINLTLAYYPNKNTNNINK